MDELRVCHVLQGLAIGQGAAAGGAERFALELAGRLAATLPVTVCSLRTVGGPAEEAARQYLTARGVAVVELDSAGRATPAGRKDSLRNSLAALPALAAFLRGRSFDVVHTHGAGPDMLAALLRPWLGGIKLIRSAQNERELAGWPLLGGLFYGWAAPLAFDAEVGVSRTVGSALDRRPAARLLGRRSTVIHNSIDLSRFAPSDGNAAQARALMGLDGGGPVLGTIGRLVEQKGHRFLLEAMALIRQAHPDARLAIIGSGPLQGELEAQARRLGLAGGVRFLGARADVDLLLPGLDALVSASLWEGLSIVLLEALAAGVPVVATEVSGSREVLADGGVRCGLIVRPGDAGELANAVLSLLADPAMGRQLRAAGRQRVRQFDIAEAARKYSGLYESLAGAGREPPVMLR